MASGDGMCMFDGGKALCQPGRRGREPNRAKRACVGWPANGSTVPTWLPFGILSLCPSTQKLAWGRFAREGQEGYPCWCHWYPACTCSMCTARVGAAPGGVVLAGLLCGCVHLSLPFAVGRRLARAGLRAHRAFLFPHAHPTFPSALLHHWPWHASLIAHAWQL